MQTMTKSAKRERIAKLEKRMSDLKDGYYMQKYHTEIVKMIGWFDRTYGPMPYEERMELSRAWEQYYKNCAQSPESLLFKEMAQASQTNDSDRIKQLQEQARQMLKNGITEVNRPTCYDPQCWFNTDWCANYNACKTELKSLESDMDEVLPITGGTW